MPERVWQELARGLMEATPSRMFELLRDCGALRGCCPKSTACGACRSRAEHHPEIDTGVHVMLVLDRRRALQAPLPVRFAACATTWARARTPADMLPRHIGHEQRSVKLLACAVRAPEGAASTAASWPS